MEAAWVVCAVQLTRGIYPSVLQARRRRKEAAAVAAQWIAGRASGTDGGEGREGKRLRTVSSRASGIYKGPLDLPSAYS